MLWVLSPPSSSPPEQLDSQVSVTVFVTIRLPHIITWFSCCHSNARYSNTASLGSIVSWYSWCLLFSVPENCISTLLATQRKANSNFAQCLHFFPSLSLAPPPPPRSPLSTPSLQRGVIQFSEYTSERSVKTHLSLSNTCEFLYQMLLIFTGFGSWKAARLFFLASSSNSTILRIIFPGIWDEIQANCKISLVSNFAKLLLSFAETILSDFSYFSGVINGPFLKIAAPTRIHWRLL